MRSGAALAIVLVAVLLAGCGTVATRAPEAGARPGGYYKDDGPGPNPPANIDAIADAEPRVEPLHRFANNPYTAFGRQYVPFTELRAHRERGRASWYGRRYHGQRTSGGEPYDMYAMTAAHPLLPIPSYARVTNLANGRSVVVRINDRGPFISGRIIDLSYAAAWKLGYVASGSAPVEVEAITPGEIQLAAGGGPPPRPPGGRGGGPPPGGGGGRPPARFRSPSNRGASTSSSARSRAATTRRTSAPASAARLPGWTARSKCCRRTACSASTPGPTAVAPRRRRTRSASGRRSISGQWSS